MHRAQCATWALTNIENTPVISFVKRLIYHLFLYGSNMMVCQNSYHLSLYGSYLVV